MRIEHWQRHDRRPIRRGWAYVWLQHCRGSGAEYRCRHPPSIATVHIYATGDTRHRHCAVEGGHERPRRELRRSDWWDRSGRVINWCGGDPGAAWVSPTRNICAFACPATPSMSKTATMLIMMMATILFPTPRGACRSNDIRSRVPYLPPPRRATLPPSSLLVVAQVRRHRPISATHSRVQIQYLRAPSLSGQQDIFIGSCW